jgi:hypothetical protein
MRTAAATQCWAVSMSCVAKAAGVAKTGKIDTPNTTIARAIDVRRGCAVYRWRMASANYPTSPAAAVPATATRSVISRVPNGVAMM